jgi:hypothetical protein
VHVVRQVSHARQARLRGDGRAQRRDEGHRHRDGLVRLLQPARRDLHPREADHERYKQNVTLKSRNRRRCPMFPLLLLLLLLLWAEHFGRFL